MTDSNLTVVVVDDSRDTADSTAELLAFAGCKTHIAVSGEECLQLVASERPDVVLLDIRMPRMDGYEVARRITATFTEKPPLLVAVTGCGTDADRQQAIEAGFHLHLVKPVDPAVLVGMIRRIHRAIIPTPRSDPCREPADNMTNRSFIVVVTDTAVNVSG